MLLSHKSPDSIINVTVEFGEGEGKVPLDAIAERAKKYQPKPKITYKMIQEYVESRVLIQNIFNSGKRIYKQTKTLYPMFLSAYCIVDTK